jgi:hypothetical protein
LGDGWLGASCTAAEAETARITIEAAAADAGRRIDPEHFGMSIGYADQPLDDRQLAAIAARTGHRDVDPRDLVPVGTAGLRRLLQAYIGVGISKFVVRRIGQVESWDTELAGLAAAVGDLQT